MSQTRHNRRQNGHSGTAGSWLRDRSLLRRFQDRRPFHERRHDHDRGRHHRVRAAMGSAAVPHRCGVRQKMDLWRPDRFRPPHHVRDAAPLARSRHLPRQQPGIAGHRRGPVPEAGPPGRHAAGGHRHHRASIVVVQAGPGRGSHPPGHNQPARRAGDGTGDHCLPETPAAFRADQGFNARRRPAAQNGRRACRGRPAPLRETGRARRRSAH